MYFFPYVKLINFKTLIFSSPDPGDGFDDFARFQTSVGPANSSATHPVNPNDEYYDDEDDDINFEPQNGYGDEDDLEYDDQPEIEVKKKKERLE